jgi:hypothetical protein
MAGVDVYIGARVIFVELPTVYRDLGRGGPRSPCAEYTLDDDELHKRLTAIPGYDRCEGLQINGLYPLIFGHDCPLDDEQLVAAVRRAANLTHRHRS